ncbi:hypothetical protein V5799_031536 [Amblyomma americanum]|uniref:Rho-GAP domain-containing protein n=1 Tax=Amblyomma americanum TaxID=6943 RepID=A0AAQ4EJY4_AMBAM
MSATTNTVAALLKDWLQQLPTALLPLPIVKYLVRCREEGGIDALLVGLPLLSEDRLACLRNLIVGLGKVAETRSGSTNSMWTGIAPSIYGISTAEEATGKDLAGFVFLVEALIGSAKIVGYIPPPGPDSDSSCSTLWYPSTHPLFKTLRSITPFRKTHVNSRDARVPTTNNSVQQRRKLVRNLTQVLPCWKNTTWHKKATSNEQPTNAGPEHKLSEEWSGDTCGENTQLETQGISQAAGRTGKSESSDFGSASSLPKPLRLSLEVHSEGDMCGLSCAYDFYCGSIPTGGSHQNGALFSMPYTATQH